MKISWGWKIALLYGGFVVFVLSLVMFSMGIEVNLVTDDYYEKELVHQEHIDKVRRTEALDENLKIISIPNQIEITFPKINNEDRFLGTIHMYRPSNNEYDEIFEINPINYLQIINTSNLEKGYWKIKIDWEISKTSYFTEKLVMVN